MYLSFSCSDRLLPRWIALWLLTSPLGLSVSNADEFDPINPARLSVATQEELSEVLILATPHLRALGEEFDRKSVEPLIERLRAFEPTIIGVESLAPGNITAMLAGGEAYQEVLMYFARDHVELGRAAQTALGNAAMVSGALESLTPQQTDCEKGGDRQTILRQLAAYELESAVLQWSYIKENERKAGGGIDEAMARRLNELLQSPNEIYSIAVPLARQLCHQHLIQIDDHLDKNSYAVIADELNAFLQGSALAGEAARSPVFKKSGELLMSSNKAGDLLEVYRFLNSAEYGKGDVEAQWNLFLRTDIPSGVDRARLALWDVRNLGIAANIRRATAAMPGGKMLVIIGASHKHFLEAYLRHAMDVKIVSSARLLAED
jgi:hypothetical protein